jgi:hypothetical protein
MTAGARPTPPQLGTPGRVCGGFVDRPRTERRQERRRTRNGQPTRVPRLLAPRTPELLRLGNADLAAVVAPQAAGRILAQIETIPEDRLGAELEHSGRWCCCRHPEFSVGLRDTARLPR